MSNTYGYHKKILHIDLTKQEIEVEEPNDVFYRKYIGSGIMAAYYLLKKYETENGSVFT
ncbi:hypothetical protein RWE15_03405 [Virgibacillus halophilus]|uniref:Aldehyde ferredoxin oxidoreductase N-terminal domain-containing protein n=1 Tax=Tigheibacillus halophilus TaxID=361280 RepID=A0ABU5C2X1_9BACI|nr:hypothetical protein [Virgibacillus halophilus]